METWRRTKTVLVFDASVIIELINAGILDDLRRYRDMRNVTIMIPQAVVEELREEGVDPAVRGALDTLLSEGVFTPMDATPVESELRFRHPALGQGEIGVIATAITLKGSPEFSEARVIPVLDDRKARRAASGQGLEVHGTLWLLLELKRSGALEKRKAIETLERMPERGFRISEHRLKEVIEEVKRDC